MNDVAHGSYANLVDSDVVHVEGDAVDEPTVVIIMLARFMFIAALS